MDPSASLEDAYPFDQLAAGPRQPRVELPVLDRSRAEMGDRWFPDKGPATGVAGAERIRVGVLPGGEPSPELTALFARYGHTGPIPVVESAAVLERWMSEPGFVLLLGPAAR